ncbi:MAG: hypothetical protein IPJ67_02935 [Candidatus Moraniibacteriota bacterium]|nr:MAG: hypothetical protein IPJ67_02935 [Candidatus Moranbacteria bacterium]
MKRKKLRVFFTRGMTVASLPVLFGGILRGDQCVQLRYFLVTAGRIPNISGWPIREVHVSHSVYGLLLETMKSSNLSIEHSEMAIDSSEEGNEIIFHVRFCHPSLLRGVNRRFGVFDTQQGLFFPFSKRQEAVDISSVCEE